jgi:hypothetical protein
MWLLSVPSGVSRDGGKVERETEREEGVGGIELLRIKMHVWELPECYANEKRE